MRIVFMGTPAFAADILQGLIESHHEVVGCFTRPDAVRGRGKKLVYSPVKGRAVQAGIPVYEFSSMKSDEAFGALASLRPDAVCVAAYGAILPKRVLELPRFGCLNVHGSLLPRWRGAAPIERAILAGDELTGIGIMQMEEGLDTGDVAEERSISVFGKSSDQLYSELAVLGGEALVKVLDACRCVIAGKSLSVLEAHPVLADDCPASVSRGEVAFAAKRLFLGCNDSILEVVTVKPEGKKPMEAKAFAAGIQGIKQGGIEWQEIHG